MNLISVKKTSNNKVVEYEACRLIKKFHEFVKKF